MSFLTYEGIWMQLVLARLYTGIRIYYIYVGSRVNCRRRRLNVQNNNKVILEALCRQ